MRRTTLFLLVFLSVAGASSRGQQHRPRILTPQIVATFERLGRTSEIPPTTIYTPPQQGTFRISTVMVETESNGTDGAGWVGQLSFTNAAGLNSDVRFQTAVSARERQTGVSEFPIRAKAGKPIRFSVSSVGNIQNTKYNVWIVVEQLM